MELLFVVSAIYTLFQLIKEALTPVNTEPTIVNKYKDYPEPHRGKDGKIIIENCLLYNEDIMKYNGAQVMEWVRQGKYNLEGEALEKENQRLREKYGLK